eukprot:865282-Prorocentrum_minimum.AAC.1
MPTLGGFMPTSGGFMPTSGGFVTRDPRTDPTSARPRTCPPQTQSDVTVPPGSAADVARAMRGPLAAKQYGYEGLLAPLVAQACIEVKAPADPTGGTRVP